MKTTMTFNDAGLFKASSAAESWLTAHGFSFGSSQVDGPQAIWFGECGISKWRNLSAKKKRECHATLTGDGRNGPMLIALTNAATPEAIEAFNRDVPT